MRHLVIGQRQKAPNFSAFHWSPHGSLITFGQHFVTTRVAHLPKRTETSLITESDQSRANHQLLQLCMVRTAWSDLCGPCIAAKAGLCYFEESFSSFTGFGECFNFDGILHRYSYKQTVQTLIRHRVLWRLNWVCTASIFHKMGLQSTKA